MYHNSSILCTVFLARFQVPESDLDLGESYMAHNAVKSGSTFVKAKFLQNNKIRPS